MVGGVVHRNHHVDVSARAAFGLRMLQRIAAIGQPEFLARRLGRRSSISAPGLPLTL